MLAVVHKLGTCQAFEFDEERLSGRCSRSTKGQCNGVEDDIDVACGSGGDTDSRKSVENSWIHFVEMGL